MSHLPKVGIPMIMRKIEKGEDKGTAKVWSYPGMEKAVQTSRKKIEGVSELFTLDACRHGGMTELEEAEQTQGQSSACSGTRLRKLTAFMQGDYAPRLGGDQSGMPICWRRSRWRNRAAQSFQMAGKISFQMGQSCAREQNYFRK